MTVEDEETDPRILSARTDRVVGASGWVPPWMLEIVSHHGLREIPGERTNAWIRRAYNLCGLPNASDDKDAWCSAGACLATEDAGVRSPRSARARDWMKWGIPLAAPVLGCWQVFKRFDPHNPNAAHVNLFTADLGVRLVGYGCNQGNAVGVDARLRSDLLGWRWTDDPRYPPPA